MNKTKRNFGLFAAIFSLLLLTWGNINAQTTMPVTIAFDVVGYLNGYSLNTRDYADFRAYMQILNEDRSLYYEEMLNSVIDNVTGYVTIPIDWHPTATFDLALNQKYYFVWGMRLDGVLWDDGQFQWNVNGVGNSFGAQWLEQNYEAYSWIRVHHGSQIESDWESMADPIDAFANASLYTSSLHSRARLGSSLLDIWGTADSFHPIGCCEFQTWARGEALIQPLPEPASLVLLGAGVLGLGVVGWYRRRRKD